VGAALAALGLIALALYVAFPPRHEQAHAAADAGAPPRDVALASGPEPTAAPDAAGVVQALATDAAAPALVAAADVATRDAPTASAIGRLFAPGALETDGSVAAPLAPPGLAPLRTNAEALSVLARWYAAITATPLIPPLEEFYIDRPRFRGAGDNASPGVAQVYWTRFFGTGGTLRFDWERSTWNAEAPDQEAEAARTCDRIPDAEGPVVKVRAWAREYTPNRVPEVGCPTLEGVYLIRLRRVRGALRICYETWSTREGLCASCPTARACRGLEVDAPPP
jgi:hypothetical protein